MRTPEEQEQFLNAGRFNLVSDEPRISGDWLDWLDLVDVDSWLITIAMLAFAVLVLLVPHKHKF
jgi:hypothetical protein